MPMKIVTCQVTAYRYTAPRAGRGGAAGGPPAAAVAVGRGADRACGSHNRTARAAGAASQPRVSATEPPVPCQSGTLTSEATIAPADSAVMYRPMRKPARSGQRRLIRL